MTTQEEDSPREELRNTEPNNVQQNNRLQRFHSSLLDFLPASASLQQDRQAFRTAFIHSAALLFILVCGACALLAYEILQPFLRSLLWSILAGAFLFPFKNHLTRIANQSLKQLEDESCLLFYGLAIILPLKKIDRTIESIGPFCKQEWKKLLTMAIVLSMIKFLKDGTIYRWISTIGYDFLEKLIYLVHFFDSAWVTALVIGYLIAVILMYENFPRIKMFLNYSAIPIWFILVVYLSQFLPSAIRLITVILSIILIVVGVVVDMREHADQNVVQTNETPDQTSSMTNISNTSNHSTERSTTTTETEISVASSTPYFSFVLWSLVATKIYQFYHYLFAIFVFVVIYKMIKYLLSHLKNYLLRQETVQYIIEKVKEFFRVRRSVLTPSPLQGLIRFFIKGDKKFNQGLRESIDYLVSALMIVTLLITVLFGSIFLIIQIQQESVHMIKLTSSLINETIVLHPSFQYMLPDKEHMGKLMDKAVENVYSTGKTWIVKQVNTLGDDSEANAKLENDVLQLWDRLYDYMLNTSNLLSLDSNHSTVIESLSTPATMLSNFDFHPHDIYSLVKNNIGVLHTILDSIWKNTTLLLTLISAVISFIFTGGFALFNFVISFFVFVTLLFYLLSTSNQPIYRPTEWLNNTLAVAGKGLGKAVDDAVTSVFVVSLKIAAFYGLYTYVLHTIIGSNLVFLPAVIASLCAIILKSYWAALPGCLDLWLVQQRPVSALLLLAGQMAPVYVVDTAIYSELKGGGHQYLTALAIAGGVYYRGIEGALIGPIVLCCLLVGAKLYNDTMTNTLSSNTEQESNQTSSVAQ